MKLKKISEKISKKFDSLEKARERSLSLHRDVIKSSGLSIRATHRGEYDEARKLTAIAKKALEEIEVILKDHPQVYYAGFVQDAQKEFAEANITLALILGENVPDADELKVDYAAYLNGLGEAVGELRRHILDLIRIGEMKKGESFLEEIDDIYYLLISMDYPDAITRNLRRTTDLARSIIERTRGDLTNHLGQLKLEKKMSEFEKKI